jgi:uncharacterized protein (TIGR02246 family)
MATLCKIPEGLAMEKNRVIASLSFGRLVRLFLTLGLLSNVSIAATASTPEDEVRAVVARVIEGFATYDAAKVAGCYTDDAVWQNPFGVRLRGSEQIQAFLTRLFDRPGYRSANDTEAPRIQSVRLLGPDVAVVWSEETSNGQIENGKPLGERRSHYLEVLRRTAKGWLITDDMIMDERTGP